MLITHDWRAAFPDLAGLSDHVSGQLDKHARFIRKPSGAVISSADTAAESLLLVVAGTLRVQQRSAGGRDKVLYHIQSGESCFLTSACLLAYRGASAQAVAETDVEAVLIPRSVFDALMLESKEFRAFVFASYSSRMTDLLMKEDAFSGRDRNTPIH
ncbi:cyclic nucleotide-binding domain-containing protein [uncultured Sulfitobacter sp.]|uniref:Crp/Fnr family transcriptional regulator n=1 Tax=uncultured Sulfitobacter sp. TaxID=191468 RepID=UPI0030DD1DBA|tara:strand:+ start:81454 stop:81924 length:471 start_codon:yes stop_codon:yes gene_type:complete